MRLQTISPSAIHAGLALTDRRALCGLLATLETAHLSAIAGETAAALRRSFDRSAPDAAARLTARAEAIHREDRSDDALRLALWRALTGALETARPEAPPLSEHEARRDAAALAVRAALTLGPGAAGEAPGRWTRLRRGVSRLRDEGLAAFQAPVPSFPDIVAHEAQTLAEGLAPATLDALDPGAAQALCEAQGALKGLAAAGGGWAGFAALVGTSGFAPYILAAKASALLPFVGGPALVSFLFVLTNPLTLLAGAGALIWAGHGRARQAQAAIAARIAVLLALQGMGQEREGLGRFVSAQRRAARGDAAARPRLQRIEARIGRPLPDAAGAPPGDWNAPAPTGRGAAMDALAAGGLTAADLLHHAACIDRQVLAAADFSRAADIADPFAFALHASDFASRGAEIALRGYTAERLVLARLIEDGHAASIAPGSATPGYDLLVDGAPVQVKCGLSPSLLEAHFAKYPDIPVIADAALARKAAESGADWAPMVSTVEGFELEAVEAAVQRSLDAAEGLAGPDVVLAALGVGAARGAWQVWRGEIPARDLPAWLALDLAARGGLAAVGAKAGAVAGLAAMGPAGAVILGPALGAASQLGAGALRARAERLIRADWHARLNEAGAALEAAYRAALGRRVELLSRRAAAIPGGAEILDWLAARAVDDAAHAAALELDLGAAPCDEAAARRLLAEARRQAPSDRACLAAGAALQRVLEARPGLTEALSGRRG
ncbi:hypothetical protein ACQ5SO_10535 [Rhodovulum sp. DZ06]|uniref:hypothetical protein n=1 Tax=Rhodovulum sp. DZ06 TaxID=3425126 RepID=UPI003D334793